MPLEPYPPHIEVKELTLAYGDVAIQQGLSFHIQRGEIFVVMGGSGCGKSTLMREIGVKSHNQIFVGLQDLIC
jgi:phospholipid/cholesterol/gamma-HCH transport system ATP-binding protein